MRRNLHRGNHDDKCTNNLAEYNDECCHDHNVDTNNNVSTNHDCRTYDHHYVNDDNHDDYNYKHHHDHNC